MRKKTGLRMGAFALACFMMLGNISMNAYAQSEPKENKVKIGLLSDTHYFSQSLYSDCDDFTTALNSDRKMLKESDAILNAALDVIIQDEPDFVLVSGDLTKDGEQVNHEAFAAKLTEAKEELAEKGIDTNFYVIDGNHDINNAHGKDFSSGHAVDADRTTVEEFKEIYKDFGYGEDSVQYSPNGNRGGSLSYVTRPEEGYTLIAVDSAKYSSDQTMSGQDIQETGGVISQDLLNWVTAQAREAKQRGDIVMVVQHHGVVPHFGMEPTVMADYLVDNWQEVEQAYADAGISYVFTGHMHANDIAAYTSPVGNVLYDIETGSLLTYPSLLREAEIEKGTFANDLSSTIQVETKKPGVVYYTDLDTGELIEIADITEYGKAHTLSNEVIKTMLAEDLLKPIFENILQKGGAKTLIANLIGVEDAAQVSSTVADILTGILPTDKENGLQLSAAGFTFSIYYDAETAQIKISQITASTLQEENVIRVQMEDGDTVDITIPEEFGMELRSQIEALEADQPEETAENEAKGILDPIELFAAKSSVASFIDNFLNNVDQELIAQPERIFKVLNTLLDAVLNAPIDEGHNVFQLVNYAYQEHLAGDEACEDWAESAISRIQSEGLLNSILISAIKNTQPALKEMMTVLPIDLSAVIEKGNSSLTTNIAYSTVIGMVSNAGDLVDMVDLSTLLPDSVLSQISELAYNVAYSMTHDDNFVGDNKSAAEISRMLPETILDAENTLESAKKIEQGNYTDESYQNVMSAIDALENVRAQGNREAIKAAIVKVNEAIDALEEKAQIIVPEKPEQSLPQENHSEEENVEQNQLQGNSLEQNQSENSEQSQPQQNAAETQKSGNVQTGDTIYLFIAIFVIAAVLELIFFMVKKAKVCK